MSNAEHAEQIKEDSFDNLYSDFKLFLKNTINSMEEYNGEK